MLSNCYDVIIVGGGPAGSATAACCAQRGLRARLLERQKFPRDKICGDILNPNCWPIFERIGVANQIAGLPHQRVRGVRLTTPTASLAADFPSAPPCVAIGRSLLDACLLAHAQRCGTEVLTEFSVADIHRNGGSWEIIGHERGSVVEKIFRGRWLIGADGSNSLVARKAGLAVPRRELHRTVAFHASLPAGPAMDDCVQLHLYPSGYCGIVGLGDGVNLCILTTPNIAAATHGNAQHLLAATARLNPHFAGLVADPPPDARFRAITPLATAPNRACGDHVLLVGDALRTLEPFTGQGIYFALRTGELAAEEICSRDLPSRLPRKSFVATVAALYRQHARTNLLFRHLLYAPRWASPFIGLLSHQSQLTEKLTRSVMVAR